MTEMEIVGVQVELPANTPVLLLRERTGAGRVLQIYIGGAEASAIHQAMGGETPPRPLTHDLMALVLEAVDVRLTRVTVTDLREGTYFAELHLEVAGEERIVSARPSDGVALAVRCDAPVFVDDAVLDEAALPVVEEEEEGPESEALVDEFKKFIEDINPEDFES